MDRRSAALSLFFFAVVLASSINFVHADPSINVTYTVDLPLRMEIRYLVPTLNVFVNVSATICKECAEWGAGGTRIWITSNGSDLFIFDVYIRYDVAVEQSITYAIWSSGALKDQVTILRQTDTVFWLHFEITTTIKEVIPTKDEIAEVASEKVVEKLNTRLEGLQDSVDNQNKLVENRVATMMQWIVIVGAAAGGSALLALHYHGKIKSFEADQQDLWRRVTGGVKPRSTRRSYLRPTQVQRPVQAQPVVVKRIEPVK